MERKPLTRQRSPWERDYEREHVVAVNGSLAVEVLVYRRRVSDGRLTALVSHEPAGWHMSISHTGNSGRLVRYPTWDEIAHGRYELLPGEITVAMFLPPEDEYVALHDTTFHLHEVAPDA